MTGKLSGDILPSLNTGLPLHGHKFPTVRGYLFLLMPALLGLYYSKGIEYLLEPCMENIYCSIVIPVHC